MKKTLLAFAALAAVAAPALADALVPPVDYQWSEESFEACTNISDPFGGWVYGGTDNYVGNNVQLVAENSNQLRDAWLITPAIRLEAGTTYSFKTTAHRNSTDETLEVKYGMQPTAEAMTGTCVEPMTINKTWSAQTVAGTFTPTESGDYYLGFHSTSTNGTILYVGGWELTAGGQAGPVYTEVSVTVPPYFPWEGDDAYGMYLLSAFSPSVESLANPSALVMRNAKDEAVAWAYAPVVSSSYLYCYVDLSIPSGTYYLDIPRGTLVVEGGALNDNAMALSFNVGDVDPSGVQELTAGREVLWFNANGTPVSEPKEAGLYIRLEGGKASKFMIK